MQGRSRVRIRALKREPYNKPTVWVGSKVTKPIQKTAPVHMIWKIDAIVQTCGKAGRVFTKWTRRMPNVPCAVPANWTSWPENEEHHEYGYAGKDAWANEQSLRYMQEMDVFHQDIPIELHQAVLERTWKIVQEQIGHGSDLKGLKNKVWTVGNANRQCSSCGIYVSDKPEHGTQRCRGARYTTAKFNGQCCSCRFDVSTMDNCVTASHSCHTCKRRRHSWAATLVSRGEQILMTTNVAPPIFERMGMEAAVRASRERMMQREIESLRSFDVRSAMVINTDASLQGAGISWREQRRATCTPQRRNRQIHREDVDDFMAQGRHNGWAQSTEDIQRSTMTKRRSRRLNRC